MGDPLAEGRGAGEFRVHMMRKEISGMAGMDDEIGLGDRPPEGDARLADFIVLEITGNFGHGLSQGRDCNGVAGAALD